MMDVHSSHIEFSLALDDINPMSRLCYLEYKAVVSPECRRSEGGIVRIRE